MKLVIRMGCLTAGLLFAGAAAIAKDGPPILEPIGDTYEVAKGLKGEKKDDGYKKAKDVSGIACLPATAGPRRCLIVNDQNTGAQLITIDGRRITPGAVVELLGEAPSPSTLGAPPARHDCSGGSDAFSDLDGEGVAYAAPYFYVVGSHGCSRKKNAFSLSSFVLARIRVGEDNNPAPGGVETTYRVSDALAAADIVAPHFARDLQTGKHANGLNVEGVAVIDGRLFLGLRAPSLNGVAYIVAADVDDLFAPGHGRLKAKADVIPVKIGEDSGIRDLAPLPDKRLLVLTGPAQEQDVPYDLFAVETKAQGKVDALGRLAEIKGEEKGGKAEAITLLSGSGPLLVLFDSLKDGGPREYPLPTTK